MDNFKQPSGMGKEPGLGFLQKVFLRFFPQRSAGRFFSSGYKNPSRPELVSAPFQVNKSHCQLLLRALE